MISHELYFWLIVKASTNPLLKSSTILEQTVFPPFLKHLVAVNCQRGLNIK